MDAYQTAILNLTTAKATVAALTNAKGTMDSALAALSSLQVQANNDLTAAQALVGSATVGIKSVLTQRAEAERLVGIGALIDAIKAKPTLTPTEAQTAWVNAVKASITTPPIEDPVGVVSAIMAIAQVPDWAAFCALVVAGNKPDLIAAVS